MKLYCNPLNLPYRYQSVRHDRLGEKEATLYREAADPSLVLFHGRYWLFPSMTGGFFVSDDLIDWQFCPFLSEMPCYDYAPDVCAVGEYLYFCASKRGENCAFYRTKDPLHEPFEKIEGTFDFWDPDLFEDDDGRLYFFWGCSNNAPIFGVELDRETMRPLASPQPVLFADPSSRGYERSGNDHVPPKSEERVAYETEMMVKKIMSAPEAQRKAMGFASEERVRAIARSVCGNDPYLEGAWLTKHNGKYYLQYAIPGTQYNVYGDGVFVADSPLGPYTLAKNNPFSYVAGGFAVGAGHGSTMEDREGRFWHVSTISISENDDMERRLGLWKAGFDEDGELFCDQRYADWPTDTDAPAFSEPPMMLLSYGKKAAVSGGEGTEHITDESIRTWWNSGAKEGCAEVDLGRVMSVGAVQVNFADEKMLVPMPAGGVSVTHDMRCIEREPGATRWLLESSEDGEHYTVLADKRAAESDLPHDLILLKGAVKARFIRLTITKVPHGNVCLSGLRVFGRAEGNAPAPAENVSAARTGDLDMEVSWKESKDALGYNVLWGYAPGKLYHSRMVYGSSRVNIGALIKGEPVFVRVDSFNESGITEGAAAKVE